MTNIINILKQTNKKQYFIIGSILLFIIFFVIVLTILIKNNVFFDYDSKNFKHKYEKLNDKIAYDDIKYPTINLTINKIEYITIEETLELIKEKNKNTGIIYIGYPECLYCRVALQALDDAIKEQQPNIDKIYYLDINKVWNIKEYNKKNKLITKQKAHKKYKNLLNLLGDEYTQPYLLYDKKNNIVQLDEKRLKMPLIIFLKDGKIVNHSTNGLFPLDIDYQELSKNQINQLKKLYIYGIQAIMYDKDNL